MTSLIPYQIVSPGSSATAAEDGAEEPLELLAVDAVDDEVDGRIEGHHQVRDLRQGRDGNRHQLKHEKSIYVFFIRACSNVTGLKITKLFKQDFHNFEALFQSCLLE